MGPTANPAPQEVVAQLLIIVVLAGAVHWGRDGGFIAAIIASLVYVFMRLPLLTEQGLTPEILTMIGVRVLTYGVVGIVGGEICGRIKYVFARLEGSPLVDEMTGVYNARYAGQAIKSGLGQWQRYQVPFSAVELTVSDAIFEGLRPTRQRTIMRQIADHVRNDIRLVDDLAHLGEGRFMMLLPHTGKEGASVAADRVRQGVRDLLGAKDESVAAVVRSAQDDADQLSAIAFELDPAEDDAAAPPRELATDSMASTR